MRTTIDLPDSLGEEAERRARERGCTLATLVVEGLHRVLDDPVVSGPGVKLPRYGGSGGVLLVDLTDKAAVAESLNADDALRSCLTSTPSSALSTKTVTGTTGTRTGCTQH